MLGGQYIVRMKKKDAERIVTGTSGQYFTDLTVGVEPKISTELAVERAVHAVQYGGKAAGTLGAETKAALTGSDQGLVVLPQGAGVLTRHVTVRGTDATGAPVCAGGLHRGHDRLPDAGVQRHPDIRDRRRRHPRRRCPRSDRRGHRSGRHGDAAHRRRCAGLPDAGRGERRVPAARHDASGHPDRDVRRLWGVVGYSYPERNDPPAPSSPRPRRRRSGPS